MRNSMVELTDFLGHAASEARRVRVTAHDNAVLDFIVSRGSAILRPWYR